MGGRLQEAFPGLRRRFYREEAGWRANEIGAGLAVKAQAEVWAASKEVRPKLTLVQTALGEAQVLLAVQSKTNLR